MLLLPIHNALSFWTVVEVVRGVIKVKSVEGSAPLVQHSTRYLGGRVRDGVYFGGSVASTILNFERPREVSINLDAII